MIDIFQLMIKSLTSAQEHIGADAVPYATAGQIKELLALGDRAYADMIDRAQHDGLITRRWGGFISVSSAGREVARGPQSDADEGERLELAMASVLTAIIILRRAPMGNLAAAEARCIPDDVRAAVSALASDAENSRVAAGAAVERIAKTASNIARTRHPEPRLVEASTRLSEACAALLEALVD